MNKEELEEIKNIVVVHFGALGFLNPSENEQILKDRDKVLNALTELQVIKEAEPSEAIEWLKKSKNMMIEYNGDFITFDCLKVYKICKQALLKAQKQEKENEVLKEIIKSLFDRGCPLHQYTDTKGVLQIEVDDECSIMHLGEFKGVDLDKKLKEVINDSK